MRILVFISRAMGRRGLNGKATTSDRHWKIITEENGQSGGTDITKARAYFGVITLAPGHSTVKRRQRKSERLSQLHRQGAKAASLGAVAVGLQRRGGICKVFWW